MSQVATAARNAPTRSAGASRLANPRSARSRWWSSITLRAVVVSGIGTPSARCRAHPAYIARRMLEGA
ncbi:hypothetical protein [Embleya sp. AB8]|uniref:hypothetical protein n=1 Tax=Embleya sp. AB8 TaxID=3156304 RepID=UPI003C7472AE